MPAPDLPVDLDEFVVGHEQELIEFRRDLHAHPEIAHAERRTTAKVAQRLMAAGLRPRIMSSGSGDKIKVRVSGPGGHTARPHLTADLVYALGKIVTELPAALSRRVDPRSSLSLVWGRISAGLAPNAIPEDGFAAGTVRCLDEEAWHQAPDLLKGLVSSVASAYGVIAELDYVRGVPPAVNDGDSVRILGEAAELAIGPEAVAQAPQSLGGEDVAWYLESIPGALARLGIRGPQTPTDLDIHQPNFDVDERAIGVGVRLMAASALIALSDGSAPEEPVASTRGAA